MSGFDDLEAFLNAVPAPKAAPSPMPAPRPVVQAKPAPLPQAPPTKLHVRKRLNVGEILRVKAIIAERKLEGVPTTTHEQILRALTMLDERQAADEREDKARMGGGLRQGALL